MAAPAISLLAGNPYGGPGAQDGAGSAASFNSPLLLATDSAGNAYVADSGKNTIRKITLSGVVTTFAGAAGMKGSADGTGTAARFYGPGAVATDSAGNVYVADTGNSTIRKITPSGTVTTLAGTAGAIGHADGTGAAARFFSPHGIATDSAGNVYVADSINAIRKISPSGVVTTLAGAASVGSLDGTGAAASFFVPYGLATDSAGNVYVVDTGNCTIRKVTPSGTVTTLAGTAGMKGSSDGTGAAARFLNPAGISTDSAGNVYVTDQGNSTIRKITQNGVVTTLAGIAGMQGSIDGTGPAARFWNPFGIATDSAGNLYVADMGGPHFFVGGTIRKITPNGVVTTLAGAAGVTGHADGTGAAAGFFVPDGMTTDSAGNVYVAEYGNNTIRKITPAGVVTTLAGTAGVLGSADGIGAAASFMRPAFIAADRAGNVYVADQGNGTIRKITPGGVVTTLAGTAGVLGSADGTGAAASFNHPHGIATDSAGNVYVAEYGNNTIRKITQNGVVTTLAGTAGVFGSADGVGAAASFNKPSDLATDSAGNVYVADEGNNMIRKITPGGVVTSLAGTAGVAGHADGMGAAASFDQPHGIAADSAGNVYVADQGNNTIREITSSGMVTTLVGNGMQGFIPGSLPGELSGPHSVAISGSTLYATSAQGVVQITNIVTGNSLSSQTIAFGTAPNLIAGGTAAVSATASSSLAVSFVSTTPGICAISGNTVTGIVSGTCTIAAEQAGNATYNAAPEVTQSIIVGQPSTVGGACGSSGFGSFSSAPTTNLCAAGTASAVAGTGPWSWSCYGSNGGTTAICSTGLAGSAGGTGSSGGGTNTSAINFVAGWNLAGNGMSSPIAVALDFSNTNLVTSVWKWEVKGTNPNIIYPAWAFYTPLQADGGAAYAAARGFDFLTAINPGEGFWVNAKTAFTLQVPGNAVPSVAFQDGSSPGGANPLPSGWSLIAVGDNPTPAAFNISVGATPPTAGVIPQNIVTLWAWDAGKMDWYFYAPSLDSNGTLASYVSGHAYLPFGTSTLTPASGFWVHHP